MYNILEPALKWSVKIESINKSGISNRKNSSFGQTIEMPNTIFIENWARLFIKKN